MSRGCVATAAIFSFLFLAACGDNSSDFATRPSGDLSSSVCEDCDDASSSSGKEISTNSSSSCDGKSSSSSVKLSSSKDEEKTSSSVKEESSSSVILDPDPESSSSSVELNCSALLVGKAGWNWYVPKECRFNPAITYGTMTDSRDKKVYKTIKIGDQVWMAENLNYSDSTKTPSLLKRSWCYDNVAANCDVAGRLYTWAAAIDSVKLATDADNPQDCGYGKTCTLPAKVQGICPDGWHLPTGAEWQTLFTEVGGSSTAGKILKSQTGWYSNGNGTDGVGFSALPAGYRSFNGKFFHDGYYANFWSATERDGDYAYYMDLWHGHDDANVFSSNKDFRYSVRCLKDDASGQTGESSSSEEPKSSSSVALNDEPSSSSVKEGSSSSVIPALDPESSSSQKVESSSSKDPEPVEGSCSSSEYKRESCNVEKDENCIKDDRDGQTYKTVTIGTQMWMAENLNYETANSFCYGDDASNCAKSGRLYTWAAAIDSVALYDGGNGVDCGYGKSCTLPDKVQGICPEGWHLPTNAEWNTLFTAVGGKSVAGTKLKSTSSWNSSGNGADAFSFSALPAGHRYDNATYSGEGYYAYFWSSSEVNSDVAYYMFLYYDYDDAYLSRKNKGYGYSVRCLKD